MDLKSFETIDDEVDQAFLNLADINAILNRLGLFFILDGGTLLGAYRDNNFCQDDHNDIDLTIPGPVDRNIIIKILGEANKIGFTLYHFWRKQDRTTAQLSIQRGKSKVDIMFKEQRHDKAWWTIYGGKQGIIYKVVSAKHFFNDRDFEEVTLRGHRFSAPTDCEEYLTTRYGDWKTPVHASEYSCYKTDKSIIKSYEKI